MDEAEIRLQELAQKLLAGPISEEERREYDALREEQSNKLAQALMTLCRRLPWLKR